VVVSDTHERCAASKRAEEPVIETSRQKASSAWQAGLVARGLRWGIERMLALPTLRQLYLETSRRPETHFADRALGVLDVTPIIDGDPDLIPASGPLIVIANHPSGAVDGLLLTSLLARRRSDVRMLANHMLALVPDLRDELILVDPFGGRGAIARNRQPLRDAMRWVRGGGCLCVFPAGAVSHLHPRTWRVEDPAWHASLGRLVRATGASVVPCFIDTTNSVLFQLAGLVDRRLRTLLLTRELLRQRGRRIIVRIGAQIPPHSHDVGGDADAVTTALRARTDAIAARTARDVRPASSHTGASLSREVAHAIATQPLASSHDFVVFCTTAKESPRLVRHIGREREIAFRAVGEGTGREIDLDAFDDRYLHLCAWDRARDALVGAYRLGLVDTPTRPSASLYTSTLFQCDRALIDRLAPAIELGRAFVRAPYQKHYASLMLLWTGIGRFVARHPQYRFLFGAVSIGASYCPRAHAPLIAYLRRHAFDHQLARLVHPRTPPIESNASIETRTSFEAPGVPVLLRHYLKLGARVLGFNVDPEFKDALDALIVVDLPRAPEPLLRRYMGHDAARAYRAHHAVDEGPTW
jgi:putative hemolysin